jgi:hypothetical protein
MKKSIFPMVMFLCLALAGSIKAQQPLPAAPVHQNAAVITFQKDTIDYGTIPHNADGYRAFAFTNTGKEPLMISETHGSCGCTVPTAPKEPIQPGASAEIKVHYATDRVGMFIKTVTVTSNAANSPKILVIKGNVLPDAAATNTVLNTKPVSK